MLYFALRAFGFLITKHKHKNNNLFFSLTPLVIYSFSPLPYSFIHLPAVFAPYFSPFPSLSLSHLPHVFDLLTVLASPPAPSLSLLLPSHSCFLSPRPHLCNPLSFSCLTHSPLPIVLRFSYSLSSLLLFCVFVPLPFYSPSPLFSRRVVFLFSPSSSKFSSVSPVSYPI
jgi:hypothetical protein